MRRLKLLIVLSLFATVALMGLYQSTLLPRAEIHSLVAERRVKLSFLMEGNVDDAAYPYAAVADTLSHYLAQFGPGPNGSLHWGMDMLQRNPAPGVSLAPTIENFRFWGELEFASPADRFAWLEEMLFSPHIVMEPSPTADGNPAGLAVLRLPMVDGSGRWLVLPGLRYEYALASA